MTELTLEEKVLLMGILMHYTERVIPGEWSDEYKKNPSFAEDKKRIRVIQSKL